MIHDINFVLFMRTYVYIYVCVCMYVYMCIIYVDSILVLSINTHTHTYIYIIHVYGYRLLRYQYLITPASLLTRRQASGPSTWEPIKT